MGESGDLIAMDELLTCVGRLCVPAMGARLEDISRDRGSFVGVQYVLPVVNCVAAAISS